MVEQRERSRLLRLQEESLVDLELPVVAIHHHNSAGKLDVPVVADQLAVGLRRPAVARLTLARQVRCARLTAENRHRLRVPGLVLPARVDQRQADRHHLAVLSRVRVVLCPVPPRSQALEDLQFAICRGEVIRAELPGAVIDDRSCTGCRPRNHYPVRLDLANVGPAREQHRIPRHHSPLQAR